MSNISFFCKNCRLDFDSNDSVIKYAYGGFRKFTAECPKCHREQFRLVDNPQVDPYYHLSKNVIMNRDKYKVETLQPGDYGFQTYYKKTWLELEKKAEEFEARQKREKEKKERYYKKLAGYGGENKAFAKKAMKIEEKLQYG